jgi:hypothetical protein
MPSTFRISWSDDLAVLFELAERYRGQGLPERAFLETTGLQITSIAQRLAPDGSVPLPIADWNAATLPADAPEFFPFFETADGRRLGVWVEDAADAPDFVVEAQGSIAPVSYVPVARNLIELLRLELELHEAQHSATPTRDALRAELMPYATGNREERGEEYVALYTGRAASVRARLVQATSPDGMGIRATGFDLTEVPAYEGEPEGLLELAAQLVGTGHPANALAVGKALLSLSLGSELEGATRAVLAEAYRALGRPVMAVRVAR